MIKKIHKKYSKGEMTLCDYLSAHRTLLANDRTWLGYVRTALTFFIAGVTFIKFFDSQTLTIVGALFVPIGLIFLTIGLWKYKKVQLLIHNMENDKKDVTKL